MEVYRQGDVVIIPNQKTTTKTTKEPEALGHTLVRGEATMHHHILRKGEFMPTPEAERDPADGTVGFIRTIDKTAIEHINIQTQMPTKEHKPIPLEDGTEYRIIRQYEYFPDGYKRVQD